MKRPSFSTIIIAFSMAASACSSHYTIASVSSSSIVIDSRYDRQPVAKAAAFLTPFKLRVDSVMGPVVGTVAHDMVAIRPESNLSNLLADILVWAGKSYGEEPVMGLYNMGGIRAALTQGEVTYGDVLDVAPFENKIAFITLSGSQLLKLFGQIALRGGEGVSRGTELEIGNDGKLLGARLHGKEIDPEQTYRIATINYLIEGNDGMTALREGTNLVSPKEKKNDTRFIIMDYFREQTAQGKAVDAQVEGRIVVRN